MSAERSTQPLVGSDGASAADLDTTWTAETDALVPGDLEEGAYNSCSALGSASGIILPSSLLLLPLLLWIVTTIAAGLNVPVTERFGALLPPTNGTAPVYMYGTVQFWQVVTSALPAAFTIFFFSLLNDAMRLADHDDTIEARERALAASRCFSPIELLHFVCLWGFVTAILLWPSAHFWDFDSSGVTRDAINCAFIPISAFLFKTMRTQLLSIDSAAERKRRFRDFVRRTKWTLLLQLFWVIYTFVVSTEVMPVTAQVTRLVRRGQFRSHEHDPSDVCGDPPPRGIGISPSYFASHCQFGFPEEGHVLQTGRNVFPVVCQTDPWPPPVGPSAVPPPGSYRSRYDACLAAIGIVHYYVVTYSALELGFNPFLWNVFFTVVSIRQAKRQSGYVGTAVFDGYIGCTCASSKADAPRCGDVCDSASPAGLRVREAMRDRLVQLTLTCNAASMLIYLACILSDGVSGPLAIEVVFRLKLDLFNGASWLCTFILLNLELLLKPIGKLFAPLRASVGSSLLGGVEDGFDVFLSHNWGREQRNHARVLKVAEALQAAGLRPWLDEWHMNQDLTDAMVDGINGSKVFLAFVTQEYINKVDGKGALGQNDNCRKEFNHAVREKGPELMIPVLMEHGDARDDSARANARPSVAGAATSSVGSESPHDSAGESPGGTASGAATAAATGAGTCSLTSTKNWGKTIQFNIGNHLYTDLSDLNFDFGPPHEADEAFQQKMAELEKAVRKVMREASQPNSQPGRSGKLPSSGRVSSKLPSSGRASSELPLSGRASGKGRAASTHRSARAVSFVELHDAGGAAGAGHPGGSPSQRM